jgi:hypothetical protein
MLHGLRVLLIIACSGVWQGVGLVAEFMSSALVETIIVHVYCLQCIGVAAKTVAKVKV